MEAYYTEHGQTGKQPGYFVDKNSETLDKPHSSGYYVDTRGGESFIPKPHFRQEVAHKSRDKSPTYYVDRAPESVNRKASYSTKTDKSRGYLVEKGDSDTNTTTHPVSYGSRNLDNANYYYEPEDVENSRQLSPEMVQPVQNYISEEARKISKSSSPERNSKNVRSNLRTMASILKELKESILKSNDKDKKIILKLQNDHLKSKMLTNQLEQLRKENNQLKEYFYQKFDSKAPGVNVVDDYSHDLVPSKYGEMLSYYEGLLSALNLKIQEIDQYYFDNHEAREHIKGVCSKLTDYQRLIAKFFERNNNVTEKHVRKIKQLKKERDSLKLAYDKMVDLLNKQNLERALEDELQKTEEPDASQATSDLQYQNAYLRQEVDYLRNKLKQFDFLKKWDTENQFWMQNNPPV